MTIIELIDKLGAELQDYAPRTLLLDADLTKNPSWLQDAVLREHDLWTENTLILGEAQSGKSSVLKKSCHEYALRCQSNPDLPHPIWIDLGVDLGTKWDVERLVEKRIARVKSSSVVLFVDSVDEPVRVKGPGFVVDLLQALEEQQNIRVVLASRRWALEARSQFSLYRKVTTDALQLGFYSHFFHSEGHLNEFYQKVGEKRVEHLLRRALDGIGLARAFKKAGKLPETLSDLFDERLKGALERFSSAPSNPQTHVCAHTLQLAAQLLAVHASVGCINSWTYHEARDVLQKLSYKDSLGLDSGDIQTLLGTGLFRTGRSEETPDEVRYAFARDEDRERLAARKLEKLSPRKLKILTSGFGVGVSQARRGLAIQIASISKDFFDYLKDEDPLAAMLTESLEFEGQDKLLEAFFEFATSRGVLPWQKIPPTDCELESLLTFRRPKDADEFLEPWLRHDSWVARLWGAKAAAVWGTSARSNPALLKIALREGENPPARQAAIRAIAKSNESGALLKLDALMSSNDSEARASFVEARLEQPGALLSVEQQLELFDGGKRRKNIISMLQFLAVKWGHKLSITDVNPAFLLVGSNPKKFADLWLPLLEGIVDRATSLEVELSAHQVVQVLCRVPSNSSAYTMRNCLKNYFEAHPGLLVDLLAVVFSYEESLNDAQFEVMLKFLDKLDCGTLVARLPKSGFHKQRLQQFLLTCDRKSKSAEVPDLAKNRLDFDQFVEALVRLEISNSPEVQRATLLLDNLDRSFDFGKTTLPTDCDETARNVRKILSDFCQHWKPIKPKLHYLPDYWEGHTVAKKCFQLSLSIGASVSPTKLSQFFGYYGFEVGAEAIFSAAERLKSGSRELWQDAVMTSLRTENGRGPTIRYLTRIKSRVFESEARKLLQGFSSLDEPDVDIVVNYWNAIQTEDRQAVLYSFYQQMRLSDQPHHSERAGNVLLALCDDNFSQAWDELASRISSCDFPHVADRRQVLPVPSSDIANLYVAWFKHSVEAKLPPNTLYELHAKVLRAFAAMTPTTAALHFLRAARESVQVDWGISLACKYLFEAEFGAVDIGPPCFAPEDLAELLEHSNGYVANSESALFETILEAIDREVCEYKKGEGIEGFWNHGSGTSHSARQTPKSETLCQNVLWSKLRTRLETLGVTCVKERFIGPDKVDFWCEITRPNQKPLRVPVELKVTGPSCTEDWIVRRIESQLYQQYMLREGCRHGIFIVLWFKGPDWSFSDADWADMSKLREKQTQLTMDLHNKRGVTIKPIIIDVTHRSSDSQPPKKPGVSKRSTKAKPNGVKKA